jgi:hypothetical protein
MTAARKRAKAPEPPGEPPSALAAKALRIRAALDDNAAKRKRGAISTKEAKQKHTRLVAYADSLGVDVVRRPDSEWHARLRAEVEKSSLYIVRDKLDRLVSHVMISKYCNPERGSVPTSARLIAKVERVYGISPELLYEAERPPPPPPPPEEVVRSMALDGTCWHFIKHGPLPVDMSPAQSALVKVVFDGMQPKDLVGEERAVARILFGDVEEIDSMARDQAMLRLGRGSGKTTFCALYLVWRLNTCDLSECSVVDEPAAVCFSNNSRTTKLVFNMAKRILGMMADVQDGLETDNEQEVKFNRPLDGRLVKLAAIVRSAGGLAARGYWLIAVVVDEAEFMPSAKADAIIQDEDQVDALTPRMLEGCIIIMISTPGWPMSYMATTFNANMGAPKFAVCAKGPTMLMRAGDAKTALRRAKAWAKDKRKCAKEFDCEPGASGGALLDPTKLRACMQPWPQRHKEGARGGVDIAFSIDWAGLAVVERHGAFVVVTLAKYKIPDPEQPSVPKELCAEFARDAKAAGARFILGDTHGAEAMSRAAHDIGITAGVIDNRPEDVASHLRDLVLDGRLVIPDDLENADELIAQLGMLERKERPGGGVVSMKRRIKGHGHLDLAAALECAVWCDNLGHGPFLAGDTQARPSPVIVPSVFGNVPAVIGAAGAYTPAPEGRPTGEIWVDEP